MSKLISKYVLQKLRWGWREVESVVAQLCGCTSVISKFGLSATFKSLFSLLVLIFIELFTFDYHLRRLSIRGGFAALR